MKAKTQTNQVAVGTQFTFNGEPEPRAVLIDNVSKLFGAAKLEARMFVFDTLHGTNYRQIRHDLVRRQRCEAFERSIGISKR